MSAGGAGADGLFVTLMTAYHPGGIHMAEHAEQHASSSRVRRLAQSLIQNEHSDLEDLARVAPAGEICFAPRPAAMPGPRVAVLVLSVVVSTAGCSSIFTHVTVRPSPSDTTGPAGSSTSAGAGPSTVNDRADAVAQRVPRWDQRL